MPELPEVDHVANRLRAAVTGRRIETAELRRALLAPDSSPKTFARKLGSAAITNIHRRGKHILIDFDNTQTLIVHLRMSGRFHLLTPDDVDPKFAHAVFYFTDGQRLVFEDQRHFGLMKIVPTKDLYKAKEIAKLAPEPFSDEFSSDYLAGKVRSSNRNLKEFLLDQTKVCGVGNIYASEALFLSGISPRRRGKNLGTDRISRLHANIRVVLKEAMELMQTIIPDPVVIGEGIYGNGAVARWRVYDREGQPCPNCSKPIKRIRQGVRSTYYCSKCQR